mgnify:CR=1 FL=1
MAGKEKGEFGYLNYRKKLNLIKMIVSFAVVAAVLIIGFIVYKTRANIFTVAAITDNYDKAVFLPAAKMAVAYFVVLPHKPADNELKEKVESKSGSLGVYYDLIFSNSKKPIGTQAVVVSDAAVIALTNENNADKKLFETSLKDFMANDSRNVNVTLYNDEKSFLSRVSTLALSKDDSTPNMNIEKNAHSLLSMCI